MKRRSLAAWAVLAAVPAVILTSAAVSSANPVASAAHASTSAYTGDSGGDGNITCDYIWEEPNGDVTGYMSFDHAPPCPDAGDWILI